MHVMPQASREEPDMYFIGMTNYGPLEPLSMLSHGVSGVPPLHHRSEICNSGQFSSA